MATLLPLCILGGIVAGSCGAVCMPNILRKAAHCPMTNEIEDFVTYNPLMIAIWICSAIICGAAGYSAGFLGASASRRFRSFSICSGESSSTAMKELLAALTRINSSSFTCNADPSRF